MRNRSQLSKLLKWIVSLISTKPILVMSKMYLKYQKNKISRQISHLIKSHNLIKHLIFYPVLEKLQVLSLPLLPCLLILVFGARISKNRFRELKVLDLLIFYLWFCSNLFGLVMLLKLKILILLLLVLFLCLFLLLWLVFFCVLNKKAKKLNNFLRFC